MGKDQRNSVRYKSKDQKRAEAKMLRSINKKKRKRIKQERG